MNEELGRSTHRRRVYTPTGWCRPADLIAADIIGSPATLDRMMRRPPSENPFPRPARDPSSGHRFWRLDECRAWREREDARRAERLVLPEGQQQQREQAA